MDDNAKSNSLLEHDRPVGTRTKALSVNRGALVRLGKRAVRRRYCQLPVSGRRMQRFLQFRLGSHQLPIILGRFAGDQHVARANRVCTHCGSVAVADELHMIFECPALQAVRRKYAPLFSTDTNTMRSFFAQPDHMQVFKFVLDCINAFQI
ncbi:TPA: hypothetical protein ACH3X1_004952 [Trebouxia sp. C0004]